MLTILYGVYAIRFNADGLLDTAVRGVQPNVWGIVVSRNQRVVVLSGTIGVCVCVL